MKQPPLRIDSPGNYGNLTIEGHNPNTGVGLFINTPKDSITILKGVTISNVFIPLIKVGDGLLIWEDLYIHSYGGDGMNIRGSNLQGGNLICRNTLPTRPYNRCHRLGNESVEECLTRNGETVYDPSLLSFETHPTGEPIEFIQGYHVDGIGQFYSVKKDGYSLDPLGTIDSIHISSIDAKLRGSKTQGIMCSEINRYSRFVIGSSYYKVINEGYPYHAVFNQLDNSIIGSGKTVISDGVSSKLFMAKDTQFLSFNNYIFDL